MDAVSALYPFLDGSISDGHGSYVGHRVKDATVVYKDYTYGPDNRILSLLEAPMKESLHGLRV
ncbi:MAG: hypothetical protein ACYDG2_22435 [Ruminiclostridium sp.]